MVLIIIRIAVTGVSSSHLHSNGQDHDEWPSSPSVSFHTDQEYYDDSLPLSESSSTSESVVNNFERRFDFKSVARSLTAPLEIGEKLPPGVLPPSSLFMGHDEQESPTPSPSSSSTFMSLTALSSKLMSKIPHPRVIAQEIRRGMNGTKQMKTTQQITINTSPISFEGMKHQAKIKDCGIEVPEKFVAVTKVIHVPRISVFEHKKEKVKKVKVMKLKPKKKKKKCKSKKCYKAKHYEKEKVDFIEIDKHGDHDDKEHYGYYH